ncbi:hypothetical protein BDZ91DRAFT_432043 [Kalaharituber pfeilii]|nr:hypothetical protein BDZ91DRAFT_432043 [Kalaharituber pfeilii]
MHLFHSLISSSVIFMGDRRIFLGMLLGYVLVRSRITVLVMKFFFFFSPPSLLVHGRGISRLNTFLNVEATVILRLLYM